MTKSNTVSWYDLEEDWNLIEASFAKQYGIRIRQHTDMPWNEFCNLISGLMADTPLGNIISIRSEKDPKIIKQFNSNQKKIYNDWKLKQANNKLDNLDLYDKQMKALEKFLESMYGKNNN